VGAGDVRTYDPKLVIFVCGSHAVSGLDEDSFITVEKLGEGITTKVGCDGEASRSLDPNTLYRVTAKLLQTSQSNSWFQNQYNLDFSTGRGTFPVSVSDLSGTLLFSADIAWVTNPAKREYGRVSGSREWVIDTGPGTLEE
jgi:hypothetical protein